MLPLPRGAVWQLFFLLCAVLLANEIAAEERVVCYYTNWSVYRPGTAKFNPQNINPYLCTHLVYAFGGFTKDNTMKPFDKYQDIEQGGYAKFTGLKTYNKQLKTMIAIGGWNEASSRFSPLVASSERRQQFIKNILKFLRQNHFDGIDLDWEYPAHREGGKPRDKENYAQFVQELRAEFDRESAKTGRPRLLLTMAVPAGIQYIEKGYDIPKLNKYLDWFNLLTYDFHSSTEPSANHHAPLYSLEEEDEYNFDSDLNIDYSIKFYLEAGADREKLVLGIPTYGRSYTLFNEDSTDLGAPADGPGEQGDATREKGYLAYYEICQNIKEDPDWKVVQPNPKAMGPYAYKGNQWVGYDDEDIVRKKAEYVVENGLGGIMFWAIDNDDFRGICTGKPYPLIEAAKEAYLDRLGVGDNEVAKPSLPKKKPLRNRNRIGSANRNKVEEVSEKAVSVPRKKATSRPRSQTERTTTAPTTTTGSSLYVGGRTTPAPPTTPDPGSDFKCEDEGFFQHPRDCKKYFWCLDSGPSNLGIVAHQFTCPSGLYFNPAADSCDFARNVPCNKNKDTTTTAKPASTTTTTTTPRTTTSSYRITAATSRNTFTRFTTTTTETPVEEEEEYDDEPEDTAVESEEDPRVIKELIDLIKKVGGIEELEKHILQQDDGTVMLKKHDSSSSSSADVTTTPSSISKKLYEKVLNRPANLSAFRNKFTSSSLFRSTTKPKAVEKDEDEENNSDSKYSSVVRNSRPGPQNAGIDKLPEFEGFLKEKKQYVTIQRSRPSASSAELNQQENDDVQQDSEDNEEDKVEVVTVSSSRRPTSLSTPSYTSIRRTKPTTSKPEIVQNDEEVDEVKEEPEVQEKKSYNSLNRLRARSTTVATSLETESTTTAPGSRYKFLERTRPTRRTLTTLPTSKEQSDEAESAESEEPTSVTVQYLEPNEISTQSPTQQANITTRSYTSIGRRTTTTTSTTSTTIDQSSITTTTLPESFLSDTTTPEPIIISTNTPTTTTTTNPISIQSSTQTSQTNPTIPALALSTSSYSSSTLQDVVEDATIAPKIPNSQATDSGLDTQELDSTDTTATTTTDDTDRNEVTIPIVTSTTTKTTTKTISITTPSSIKSQSSLNNNNNNNNSIRGTSNNKYNGGGNRRQQLRTRSTIAPLSTATDTATDPNKDTSTSTNEFLGTVSSPRPFGFPRRRTRPNLTTKLNNGAIDDNASSLSSSAAPTSSPSSSEPSTTPSAIIKKVRTKVPGRRQSAVRRRLFTTTQPSSNTSNNELNSDVISTITSIDDASTATPTATSLFKNNRRTRPNYLTTISAKLKPTAKALSLSSSSLSSSSSSVNISNTTGSATSAVASVPSSNDITFVTVNKLSNQKSSSGVIRRKFTRPLNGNRLTNNSTAIATTSTITNTTTSSGSGSTPTGTGASPSVSAETSDEVDTSKNLTPLFKKRFPPSSTSTSLNIEFNTSPLFLDTSVPEDLDQIAKSSIQESKFFHNQIGDSLDDEHSTGRISISTSIFKTTTTPLYTTYEEPNNKQFYATSTRKPSLRRPQKTTPIPENTEVFISRRRPHKTPAPFNKIIETPSGQTYKPSSDYDYYDDGDERVVDKPTASQVKVVLHGKGIIECLDQGNFPHPLSCRKFISCAKFETGGVVGWEYTCPKGLSYDPVGGMCNWSAGLGCNE